MNNLFIPSFTVHFCIIHVVSIVCCLYVTFVTIFVCHSEAITFGRSLIRFEALVAAKVNVMKVTRLTVEIKGASEKDKLQVLACRVTLQFINLYCV